MPSRFTLTVEQSYRSARFWKVSSLQHRFESAREISTRVQHWCVIRVSDSLRIDFECHLSYRATKNIGLYIMTFTSNVTEDSKPTISSHYRWVPVIPLMMIVDFDVELSGTSLDR